MNTSAPALRRIAPQNAVRLLGHPVHAHDVPHLVYVAVGLAHLTIDGQPVTLRARECLWLAPGVPHAARYEEGSLVLGPMLSSQTVPSGRFQQLGVVPAITEIMTVILGVAPQTPEQVAPLRAALDEVLVGLRTEYFSLLRPRHPVMARLAGDAVRSEATLTELAARHGFSVRQVQRVFRDETGLPFARWRAQARLNVAIGRLRAGESLGHIARAVGYGTRSGLAKALAREVAPQDLQRILNPPVQRDGVSLVAAPRDALN